VKEIIHNLWSKRKLYLAAALLGLLVYSLTAPAQAGIVKLPSKETITVKIVGTRNFGEEVLFEKEAEVRQGATAGEALEQVAEIEMSGSYIETVNGLRGDQKEYWLYYINGVLANVFAHRYIMQPGDVMNWDFHNWRFYMQNPMAVIGQFPEPCVRGYNGKVAPAVVVYDGGFKEKAGYLKEKLEALGVADVSVKETGSLTAEEKEKFNIFILAGKENALISEINGYFKERELVYFDVDRVVVRDFGGKPAKKYGMGYGVIQAMQNPWNPKGNYSCESTVWAVTGLDDKGVNLAAGVLIDQPEKLKNTFAVVVGEDELIRAPIGPEGEKTIALAGKESGSKDSSKKDGAQAEKAAAAGDSGSGHYGGVNAENSRVGYVVWPAVILAAAGTVFLLIKRNSKS
jgi:hypothetical protein